MLRHEIEDGELDDEDDVIPKYGNIPRSGSLRDSDSDDELSHRVFEKPKPVVLKAVQDEEKMEVPAKRRRCKTKNNIWSTVVADQMLSGDLTNWSGVEETKVRDRDVESYDFSKAKDDTRPDCLYQEMLYSDKMIKDDSLENFDPDMIETFGSVGEGPKGLKRRLGNQVVKGIKSRLGEKATEKKRQGKEQMNITSTAISSEEFVVDELMMLLGEPENMKQTFVNVVSTIGVERSLEIFRLTNDTEEDGGILTQDGSRRRSTGGVFLYLLKTMTSPAERKLIFPIEGDFRRKKKVFRSKNRGNSHDRIWELPQDKLEDSNEKIDTQKFNADNATGSNGDNIDMEINQISTKTDIQINVAKEDIDKIDKIHDSNLDIDLDFI